jgi:hypothetical protein
MNCPASISANLTTQPPPSALAERPIALWALSAVLVAIAVSVLVLDASITTEQRIALLVQSGMFP